MYWEKYSHLSRGLIGCVNSILPNIGAVWNGASCQLDIQIYPKNLAQTTMCLPCMAHDYGHPNNHQ
jgi:hypothetical protein